VESYSVQAVLSVADKGFSTKMNAAAKTMDDMDSSAKKSSASIADIAKGAGVFKIVSSAVGVLKSSLDGAISRFDTLNQYPKVMQQIGFSAEDAQTSMDQLSAGIDGLPTSLDGIVSSTQGIAVLTRDIDKATQTSIALNDAFLASGSATVDAERGLTQYVQMLSKGAVDLESWRSLQETMGPALYEVAAAFGYAGTSAENDLYAALKDGAITFDEFNDKLIELDGGVNGFAERARTASAGVGTSFQNLHTAVVRGMEKVIRAADNSLTESGLPNFQQSIETVKTGVNTSFTVASDAVGKFVKIAAPGIKTVKENLDVLVPVLGTATSGFVAYKAAIAIDDKVKKINNAWKESKERLQALKSVTELQTKATKAQEAAVIADERAQRLSIKANIAQKEAENAQAAAKELATKAVKAKAAADSVSSTSVRINTGATELNAVAESANAAATEASEAAKKKAAIAAQYQAQANKAAAFSVTADTIAEEAHTAAETASARAAEVSSVAIAAKTAAVGVLTGEIGLATAAQLIWNTAMEANPIGAVIAVVTALVAGIIALIKIMDKLDRKSAAEKKRREELKTAIEEETGEIESNIDSRKKALEEIKNSTEANKKLAVQITRLMEKEARSADEKAELASLIDTLDESLEGLNLTYDDEADKLSMTTDALMEKIDAYGLMDEATKAQEDLVNVLKDQAEAEKALTDITNAKADAQKKYEEAISEGRAYAEYSKTLQEMSEQEEAARDKLGQLAEQEQTYKDILVQTQSQISDATSQSTAQQRIDLQNLSDVQEDTIKRITTAYQGLTESLGSLNDKIELDNETTWDQVKKNQEDTIAKTQEFADLYSKAINAGVSESYLNAIGATGPEALPLLRSMMKSGVDEVLQAQEQWEQAYSSVSHSFVDSMNLSDEDKAVLREYVQGQSGVLGTIEQALKAADFTSISTAGTEISGAIADGIANDQRAGQAGNTVIDAITDAIQNSPKPNIAGKTMADNLYQGVQDTFEKQSSSGVFQAAGERTVEGVITGVETKQKALTSSVTKVMENLGKATEKAAKSSMSNLPQISSDAFRGVTNAATSGMQKTQDTVQNGMKAMDNATRSGWNGIQASALQGMDAYTTAISNGMNTSKSNVECTSSEMENRVNALTSSFYSSGYYAAQGMANGINAGSGKAVTAARNLANTIAATVNSALKIHSPSRVTEESGEYTSEGLIRGMLKRIHDVRASAKRLAEAMVPEGYMDRLAASAGEFCIDTSLRYTGDVNVRYVFEIPVVLDGREMARASAEYMQTELDQRSRLKKNMRGYR
jgi:tape measure domain-containing protein